jgi:ribonuclease PH
MISLNRPKPMKSVVWATSSMISASEKCWRISDQSASSTFWWSTASFSANLRAARSRGLRRSEVSSLIAAIFASVAPACRAPA